MVSSLRWTQLGCGCLLPTEVTAESAERRRDCSKRAKSWKESPPVDGTGMMYCLSGEEDRFGRMPLQRSPMTAESLVRVGGHSWAVKRLFDVDVYRSDTKVA